MWWQAGFGRFLLPWPLVLRLASACQAPASPRHRTAPRCRKKGAVSWLCFGENLLRRDYFCSAFFDRSWCHTQGGRWLPHLVLRILQLHGGKPTRHFWSCCQVRGQNQGIPDFSKETPSRTWDFKVLLFFNYSSIPEWKARPWYLFLPFQNGSLSRPGCKMRAFLLAEAMTNPQQATPCLAAVAREHQDFACSITNMASEGVLHLPLQPRGAWAAALLGCTWLHAAPERAACFPNTNPPKILLLKQARLQCLQQQKLVRTLPQLWQRFSVLHHLGMLQGGLISIMLNKSAKSENHLSYGSQHC